MQALIVTLVLLLIAACVALALVVADRNRRTREYERQLQLTAPRQELSVALATREAAFLAALGPVLMYDAAGTLVRANALARERPELVASPPPPELAAGLQRIHDGESAYTLEMTLYGAERVRYLAHLRSYASDEGRGTVAMLLDVSSETDFREARRLFSAGVSHELRTPLARILALTDTLSLPLDDDERTVTTDQIRAEIDGMRQLIEEMVLLVQLESHELTGIDERADIDAAVSECVERNAARAEANSMTIEAHTTRGLVAAVLPRLLDVVLDNLVGNAITYGGSGATVRITARGLAGAVELSVADTGAGIPVEHIPRIFERFYRVEGARSGPGTGLGLAIVKHIAEEYGGRASLESAPGRGTTVTVVLPAPAAVRA